VTARAAGPADRQEPAAPARAGATGHGRAVGIEAPGHTKDSARREDGGQRGYLDLRGSRSPATTARPSPRDGPRRWNVCAHHRLRRNHGGLPAMGWPSGAANCSRAEIPTSATSSRRHRGEKPPVLDPAYVPGARYLDRPVITAASHETSRRRGPMTYSLQAQGRAR